ncbi:MAG TPA: hypothetical protein VFQ58_06260 [Flavisolibacter sp.]|jgi:hypothetical protein|nr:hypothetical protein [Flavisolibacter sp.]
MKQFVLVMLILLSVSSNSQELFVFTEPASNMATKSIGLRLNSYFYKTDLSGNNTYLTPEVMFGVSKNMMIHADVFINNQFNNFQIRGGSIYFKYRFYTNDDVQRHFRMAFFARGSLNNTFIQQKEINLYGVNSGFEGGIVATQLLHKVALSSAVSFDNAIDNGSHQYIYGSNDSKAINYTLSFGKLILPKEYKDYRQTNLNLLLDLLSQYNLDIRKYYVDVCPAAQLIINSQGRIDIGYRKQISSTLLRLNADGFFLRLEYNFFNVYK